MKNLDINYYPSLLDHLNISSNDVRNIIKDYNLFFPQVRNENVEWRIAFPIFLTPFYKFVYLNNNVLNQNDFYEYYLSENKKYFDENIFEAEILEGLRARIFRTYPSLVRDLHFSLFVSENIKEALIVYNRKLDVEEGIDLLIKLKDKLYAINLFTDTTRAHFGREKKLLRHTPFNNVQYVELPVNFKGSVKCGDFFLYGETELNQIKKTITE
jgi:hypothetical protein